MNTSECMIVLNIHLSCCYRLNKWSKCCAYYLKYVFQHPLPNVFFLLAEAGGNRTDHNILRLNAVSSILVNPSEANNFSTLYPHPPTINPSPADVIINPPSPVVNMFSVYLHFIFVPPDVRFWRPVNATREHRGISQVYLYWLRLWLEILTQVYKQKKWKLVYLEVLISTF